MTTQEFSKIATNWCPSCGRRRGPDGRCADCDPWWTSPVMQYGAPLALFVTVILLGTFAVLTPQFSGSGVRSVPTGSGVAPTFQASGPYSTAVPYPSTTSFASPSFTPMYTAPVPALLPAPANPPPYTPSVDELEFLAIQELRQMTAYTDAVVESTRQARWQQARTAYNAGYNRPMSLRMRAENAVPVYPTVY